MPEFGNFRALPVGPPKKAIQLNAAKDQMIYLTVEGGILEFTDDPVIDIPRVPTIPWINWAIARAKLIATLIPSNSQGNIIRVTSSIRMNGTAIEIVFKDENRWTEYVYPVMDFILLFENAGGQNFLITRLFEFFKEQQPIS
jgi:hypothetical protein